MSQNITTLCASHIDSRVRWLRFLHLVRSWREQISPTGASFVIPFHLSVSTSPAHSHVVPIIERIAAQNKNFTAHIRTEPLTQFQHYALLAKELGIGAEEWVIFTDDDDTWAKNRAYSYSRALQNVSHIQKLDQVGAVKVIGPTDLSDGKPYDEATREENSMGEYVELSCRFRTFVEFFARIPPTLLRSRFCDLVFCRFVRWYSEFKTVVLRLPENVYIYPTDQSYSRITNHKGLSTGQIIKNNVQYYFALDPQRDGRAVTIEDVVRWAGRGVPDMSEEQVMRIVRQLWSCEEWTILRQVRDSLFSKN